SFPDFNPEIFFERSPLQLQKIFNDPDAPLLNRGISASYPPGSVFKLITAMAGLMSGKIGLSTTYHCPGNMRIGRRIFGCWDTHGTQNIFQAITHSCDVFFYHTALAVGPQNLYEYAVKFGLGRYTGIDLPGEVNGFIPSPASRKAKRNQGWFDGDTANFAIGQGEVLVTPLQAVRLMSVFANGGYLVTPYIVKSIDGKDVSSNRRRIQPVPVNRDYINIVYRALRGPVAEPGGTASILNIAKVAIAGKTGTAQASGGQPHSWFVGFFPYPNPKFAICVLLEHGGSSHYACMITKKIIERMIEENLL
ncbi:MAG: penicillin-binding transpeptidase domain-containing protein, partial [Candidatus Omnitrophica bacterium]|nr:penicillin-binding transpeptidase domain-containing protein [Candidatus Omnitrophota bacterium]